MRIARFVANQEQLAKVFHFPAGARLISIRGNDSIYAGSFEFVVEHPALPENEPGKPLPQVWPTITTHTFVCGDEPPNREIRVEEWKWGLV